MVEALDSDSTVTPELPRHPRLSQILEKNWQAEMTGHYTYRALAEREREVGRKQTLENMALAEKEHAALWAGRLRELGEPEPVYRGSTAGDADSLKIASGATTWPCAGWKSMRAATSPSTASSSKSSAMRPAWPS